MIIVSQDKKVITNFDNIIGIQIDEHIENSDGDKDYEINIATERRSCTIGYYELEEREKEVLQEIVNRYKEYTTIQNITGNDIRGIYNTPKVYEMPKE